AVQVVVHLAGQGQGLELAEVIGRRDETAGGRHGNGGRRGGDVARLLDLLDGIGSRADAGEGIIAAGVGDGGGDDRVRAVQELDGPAGEARVARHERAAADQVVVHLAAEGGELEVAEIQAADILFVGDLLEIVRGRAGLNEAAFQDLLHRVTPRAHAVER